MLMYTSSNRPSTLNADIPLKHDQATKKKTILIQRNILHDDHIQIQGVFFFTCPGDDGNP